MTDRKKTGFFSRLFTLKHVEESGDEPAAEAPAPEAEPTIDEASAPVEAPAPKVSWMSRLRERLGRTRRSLMGSIRSIAGMSGRLDEETLEEIEAALIQGDVSMETTTKIVDRMRREARRRGEDLGAEGILSLFRDAVQDILVNAAPGFDPKSTNGQPYIVVVVGVNGVGKTTTIAKMAQRCTRAGLKTMLVAGDTFRAAAVEQLEVWAGRTGCDFVRAPHGSDTAALCYDALRRAHSRHIDVVFIDTAGRLQTKSTLMAELGKIERVIARQQPGAPHETLLVLDATTGQNAHQQVKIFSETIKLTGLVMTKLDGTAKGGVLLSILDRFHIPITLIGVGEGVDDLRDFDPEQFSAALFEEKEPSA